MKLEFLKQFRKIKIPVLPLMFFLFSIILLTLSQNNLRENWGTSTQYNRRSRSSRGSSRYSRPPRRPSPREQQAQRAAQQRAMQRRRAAAAAAAAAEESRRAALTEDERKMEDHLKDYSIKVASARVMPREKGGCASETNKDWTPPSRPSSRTPAAWTAHQKAVKAYDENNCWKEMRHGGGRQGSDGYATSSSHWSKQITADIKRWLGNPRSGGNMKGETEHARIYGCSQAYKKNTEISDCIKLQYSFLKDYKDWEDSKINIPTKLKINK